MRIAGRPKMGYYPTPARIVEQVKRFLFFTSVPFTALDQCCGEGIALAQLVSGTQAITYGVELDHHRAAEAESRIQNV